MSTGKEGRRYVIKSRIVADSNVCNYILKN